MDDLSAADILTAQKGALCGFVFNGRVVQRAKCPFGGSEA